MTDKRRQTMRRYRELAVQCERRLQTKATGSLAAKRTPSSSADATHVNTSNRQAPSLPSDFQGVDCLMVTSLLDQQQRYAFAASVVADVCGVGDQPKDCVATAEANTRSVLNL